MTEQELLTRLFELGQASEHLRWRRGLCVKQWSIDDCSMCSVQTDETPHEWRSKILLVESYDDIVRQAMPCWRWACAGSIEAGQRLAESLVVELEAMTEDETTEPNEPRWIAPPLNSNSQAHVARLHGDWGFICDCSAKRRHYSDRVRIGLLVCPCCLAGLSDALLTEDPRFTLRRSLAQKLLSYVGWKANDPPPVIWRTKGAEQSWVHRRETDNKLIELSESGKWIFHNGGT